MHLERLGTVVARVLANAAEKGRGPRSPRQVDKGGSQEASGGTPKYPDHPGFGCAIAQIESGGSTDALDRQVTGEREKDRRVNHGDAGASCGRGANRPLLSRFGGEGRTK